jgi:hypothetical protein
MDPTHPVEARIEGELVCALEELGARHGLRVPPVHQHLLAIRAANGSLHLLVRNSTSEMLFSDSRFQGKPLALTGRSFGAGGLFEVSRTAWIRGEQRFEAYYWCEVCSIDGVNPGPCACCQGPVELRERPDR